MLALLLESARRMGATMTRLRTVRRCIERMLSSTALQPRVTKRKCLLVSIGLLPTIIVAAITFAQGTPPTESRPFSAAPVATEQPPVIAFLNDLSPDQWQPVLTAFQQGLGETGYAEGQSVTFAYRWTEGRRDRLAELAADLVRANVAIVVASGDTASALAARAATSKVPILFAVGLDPVRQGLAASLEKPGGNATGLYYADTSGKAATTQQELLRLLNPKIGSPFMQVQIMDASADAWRTDAEAALANLGQNVRIRRAPVPDDLKVLLQTDPAAALRQMYERVGPATAPTTPNMMQSLQIISGPFLDSAHRKQTIALAARHGIPTIYQWSAFVEAGGLMSHGPSIDDMYAQIGRYAGEILKGSNPADMPIVTSIRHETAINLRTAAELGLTIPPALLARADKVTQ